MTEEIKKYAKLVERFLEDSNIALTMGGEPTFVSAQPEAPEWNNAAMGDEKLGYARRMAAHLIENVYENALAMQVFGKWYPGEPLPRWNVMILHANSSALWPEEKRLLLDDVEGRNEEELARETATQIAESLDLSEHLIPACEQGSEKIEHSGWVLPLAFEEGQWQSAKWPYSFDEPIPLFHGDSPVGLRLPLNQLKEGVMRTALTIEVRHGALEIFLPPLEWAGFQPLIGIIHSLAKKLDLEDLVFCGYAPSSTGDAVTSMGLAADPGVLEVNLPPTGTWEEYDRVLKQSADAASAVDLKLTKYQLNGSVYGTGGGAHLAFGGPSTTKNPFLQSPQRIASILRYWQHNPVLSYFFSGQFIGPGSQAPRVDEGPSHGLYELEVACEGLENMPEKPDGGLIDQFLKNLLTDSSGNTHRAELCFDKFHNYAMPNGRLGIVEMRAFETYESAELMSRVALFIRTVVARLFKSKFEKPLKRFGPELNDKYFLPAFLWENFLEVCADLKANGFDFNPEWLSPLLDFRCPVLGRLDLGSGGFLEVRRAFESWPLMAEESQGAATVRVVDNSSDRVQLSLSDHELLNHGRLVVNGVEVPFEPVGDQLICGLRYKCASAYPALHPHISIQSPLLFEWVDRASGKTLNAVRYYYWNPDGPNYPGRPKTEKEAAQRREARWSLAPEEIGKKPEFKSPRCAPEYRYTLDLRRQVS